MRIYIALLFFVVCTLSFTEASAQGNPLFNSTPSDTSKKATTDNTIKTNIGKPPKEGYRRIAVFNSLIKKNAEIQKNIKDRLANLSADYKNSGKRGAVFLIFLLAFLYGIFHSLGPGHGKVFVFSYILTEKPKVLRAIGTSYAIAFLHGISGLLVALIIVFSLKTYTSEAAKISDTSNLIARISYVIIFIIGVLLLFKILRHGNHHHHHESNIEKMKFIPFVVSVGLVPCPGTIITVTFLSSMGMLTVGILSSFFIILGLGITISLIGILSLYSKELINRLFSANSKNYHKFYTSISAIGALFLILFGLLSYIGAM